MPESHNYSLTIRVESDGETQSPIAGHSNAMQQTSTETLTPKKAVKALVSFKAFVKPFVKPFVDQHIQTISLRTGATEAQQRIQFAYNVAEQAVGIGENILIGLAVGNLPGALIGAGVGIISTVINYANQAEKLRLEQNLENISLRGMNVRAGGYAPSYAGSRSRAQ